MSQLYLEQAQHFNAVMQMCMMSEHFLLTCTANVKNNYHDQTNLQNEMKKMLIINEYFSNVRSWVKFKMLWLQ